MQTVASRIATWLADGRTSSAEAFSLPDFFGSDRCMSTFLLLTNGEAIRGGCDSGALPVGPELLAGPRGLDRRLVGRNRKFVAVDSLDSGTLESGTRSGPMPSADYRQRSVNTQRSADVGLTIPN